jgi:hypothetical protein
VLFLAACAPVGTSTADGSVPESSIGETVPATTAPATTPAPKPAPTPSAVPAPSTCDPNYAGQCLKDGIGDYDCSGGTGNGPNYVYGTVRVVGGDPFRLDADSDGLGCERG